MTGIADRIAGAPITWGVCEAPGWGYQMPPDRVLGEISEVGIRATELGPDGYLPTEPQRLRDLLDSHGLRLVGGFVPAVLHRADLLEEELASARRSADLLAAGGAEVIVLAAATGGSGYERSAELGADEWTTLVLGLERMIEIGAERALTVALHPHVGTIVEGPQQIHRVLHSSPVSLCIDTGHLAIGGTDPLELAGTEHDRIAHVHLKDVDRRLAELVKDGDVGYHEAVRRGLYRPLGAGNVDVAEIVGTLEASGYRGWYVLEQDSVLASAPAPGDGPIRDAAASLAFLMRVAHSRENGISAYAVDGRRAARDVAPERRRKDEAS
jgi:inosose dehydratase